MKDTVSNETIAVSQLLVDTENPRLSETQNNQADAISAMARAQSDRIVALAEHLVDNGPCPSSLPIVMPSASDEGMYCVLDGNRRVSALKLLGNPSLADGALPSLSMRKLKHLATKFKDSPIVDVTCVVVSTRDQADRWIQLTHRGQNQGAGLVEWDGQVAARYDARKGSKPVALQILDFAKEKCDLSEETRRRIDDGRFPITTLERLIKTPYVRKKLGIDIVEGDVVTTHSESEVGKGIGRIVDDIGARSNGLTVSKLKSQEDRINYVNTLAKNELPDDGAAQLEAYALGSSPAPTAPSGGPNAAYRRASAGGTARRRIALVPSDCRFSIPHHRINKIFGELKKLNVDEFANAGAVMLRVFVELSVDYYLEHVMSWKDQAIDNSKLAYKLNAAADHIVKANIMTEPQLAPVRKAVGGQTLLAASVKTLHSYVHSRYTSPLGSELRTAWDDLQPFLASIWR